MLNEKLQNNFISDFHNLTQQNAKKILKKIKSGETDFFDNETKNNFILWLNPLLDGIKNNWEDYMKDDWFIIKPDFWEKYWGDLNSWIWENNFPYYNTPKEKLLPYIIEYDENGNIIEPEMKLLPSTPKTQKNIRYNLLSNDSRKIASNIYDEQVDYFKKISEKYKNEDNFLDIIWEEFSKITDFDRIKNYGECLADTIFQNNKNSCFNAYLEDKKIKWYKKRVTENDDRVSDICRHNASQGFIPFEDNFISGHDAPPWHPWCRCHLEYKSEENLDFNIENYILKNKQIADLMEEERQQKEQEKREKEAEKERKRKEKERLEEENIKNHDMTKLFEEIMKEAEKEFISPSPIDIFNYWNHTQPWWKYDIKRREDCKKYTDEDWIVSVYWQAMRLDELWNFMVWRNGDRIWLNWGVIEWLWWAVEFWKNLTKWEISFETSQDELRDQRYYRAWEVYSQLEPNLKTKKEKEKVFGELIWEAFAEKVDTKDIWKNLLEKDKK